MVLFPACKVEVNDKDGIRVVVVPVFRHGHIHSFLKNMGVPRENVRLISEGFLIDTGEFMDRREALIEALHCGQLPSTVINFKAEHDEDELYSEDLF